MLKTLPIILFGLVLSCAVSAQCDLTVQTTNFTCDPASGGYTFDLFVTGSDSTVRFPDIGLELPLPVNELFFVPVVTGQVLLRLESGTAPDICSTDVVISPPEECVTATNNCSVYIAQDNIVCGTPTHLTAVATGFPPFTYQWNTGDTTASIAVTNTFFDYAVTIIDAEGCSSQANQHIGEPHPFTIHVESSGDPCLDGQTASLTATTFNTMGPYTYLWSTGATTQTITNVFPEQVYTVTITDGAGCTGVGAGFYHPGAFNAGLTITGPTFTNCDGTPITLEVENPDPDFEYTWIVGADTLTGAVITTTSGGHFSVIGSAIDNPTCQSFGQYDVIDANINIKDLSIISLADGCDDVSCLLLLQERGLSFLTPETVVWSLGDSTLSAPGGFLCISDPGTYVATVSTPCDTLLLPFTIEPRPVVCTDVCGSIIVDEDQDCVADTLNHDWSNISVLLVNNNTNISYPVHLNPDGTFCGTVPEGSYSVRTLGDVMTISTSCDALITEMEITAANDVVMELFARMTTEEEGQGETTASVFQSASTPEIKLTPYPNPTSGSLWFDLSDRNILPDDVLTLYDGLGRLLERTTVATLPRPWQLQDTKAGMYQVILTGQNGRLKARSTIIVQ